MNHYSLFLGIKVQNQGNFWELVFLISFSCTCIKNMMRCSLFTKLLNENFQELCNESLFITSKVWFKKTVTKVISKNLLVEMASWGSSFFSWKCPITVFSHNPTLERRVVSCTQFLRLHYRYGNTGCRDFCLRINILKGNYWILRIGLVGDSGVF